MPLCDLPADNNHWCGTHRPASGVGLGRGFFCHEPHPDPKYAEPVAGNPEPVPMVRCMRLLGHDGDHAAYTFSIHTPDTWPVAV